MGTIFAYSIGISLPIILMWAIYKTMLANTTVHRFNRIILLSIYATALFVIPLLQIIPFFIPNDANVIISVNNITATIASEEAPTEASGFPILTILLDIYILGAIAMFLKLTTALFRTTLLIKNSYHIKHNKYNIIVHNRAGIVPFSWCRWIFMNQTDYNEQFKLIAAHESAHLTQRHWIDLMIAEIVIIVNWFNPVAWLMRSALQDIHEYEADESVLRSENVDTKEYQLFLIKKTVGTRFAAIANSLNHSSLKKRITMMISKKSQSKARMRALALVPATALALVFVNNSAIASTLSSIASTEAVANMSDKDSEKSSVISVQHATDNSKGDVIKAPDEMPQFPGGMKALMEYISQNIRYPEEAIKANKEGTVIVQFVITKTGEIEETKVVRSQGESLDAEAVRVVKSLPNFIPGKVNGKPVNVMYTIPLNFKMNTNKHK